MRNLSEGKPLSGEISAGGDVFAESGSCGSKENRFVCVRLSCNSGRNAPDQSGNADDRTDGSNAVHGSRFYYGLSADQQSER